MPGILINGIVSHRDKRPYVQIDIEGHIAQLSMAEARSIARDLEQACARAEADAMIHKFFSAQNFPEAAGAALMLEFRDFRAQLDDEAVERSREEPSEG